MATVVPATDPAQAHGLLQAAHFDGLLEQSRELIAGSLDRAVSGMLEKAKDALTGMINETRSLVERRLYEETRQVVIEQRRGMEKQFRTTYLGEFRKRSDRARKIGQVAGEREESLLQLSLVGEDDYDETLKFNNMAGKLRSYCDEELVALDQRVGVLLGDANLQANDNPFSPQVICDAYKQACRHASGDVKMRGMLLRLFDDHVLDDIRSMYKEVNALLIQNAILPKIRYSYARAQEHRGTAAAATAGPAAAAPSMAQPGAAPAEITTGGSPDLFALLQNLVANSAMAMGQPGAGVATFGGAAGAPMFPGAGGVPTMPGAAGAPVTGGMTGFPAVPAAGGAQTAPGAAGPVLQGPALLGTLTRIQVGDIGAVEGGALSTSAGDPGTVNVLRELKTTNVGAGMGPMDLMTLDIIAMLFDQIFDDPKVPNGIKGIIGRMQIPMLKVAIADKTFFSTKAHPARRLLDTLGEMASRLPVQFGPEDPLFARMQEILEALVEGYKDDADIFVDVRERLEALLAEEDRRVDEASRAAAKRVEEMESLAVAKMVAAKEVKARVDAHKLPGPVVDMLVQQWLKLLLLIHVKEGKDGTDWKRAVETMDKLVWSIEPKSTREERREVVAAIPGLVKQLALGLKAVGVRSAQRTKFFSELMKSHRRAITPPGEAGTEDESAPTGVGQSGDAAAAAEIPPAAADVGAQAAPPPDYNAPITIKNPFGEGEVDVNTLDLDFTSIEGGGHAGRRGTGAENPLAELAMGTWVEFREEGAPPQRRPARLIFVTPRRTRYLFAFDRAGKDIIPYTPGELDRRFRLGGMVVIEEPRDESLFDRIMGGLLGKLRAPAARTA